MERIYVGDFLPSELIVPQNPEYAQTVEESEKEINAIIEMLGSEGRARMDKVIALMGDAQYMDLYATFAFGLRTGIQLIYELFASEEVLPSDKRSYRQRPGFASTKRGGL
ncbi:MAG: hypothetical protein J1E43_04870 [Christensenellaceae bacterium]|nr:hypothetical protein [Christensenellaceae bacterium]